MAFSKTNVKGSPFSDHDYERLSEYYENVSLSPSTRSREEKKIGQRKRKDVRQIFKVNPKLNSLVVMALDLGTSYSGFAFAFRNDPTNVIVNSSWHSGSSKLISLKCPTVVLFDKEEELVAFGFEAENKYTSMAEQDKHQEMFYFSNFKMQLYNQSSLTKDMKLKTADGKEMSAMKVVSAVIGYMKDRFNDMLLLKTRDEIREADIHYVVTIPAIWSDSAKQFMRTAASLAGIASDQLTLALEPECAILNCIHTKGYQEQIIQKENKYILVDIGGGTVDIAVHEVMLDGTMKELKPASGGPWGGNLVNKAFIEHLSELFGRDVLDRFKEAETEDFLEMERDFEMKKRSEFLSSENMVSFHISPVLNKVYEEIKHHSIREATELNRDGTTVVRDKLKLKTDIMRGFFREMINPIIQQVCKLQSDVPDVDLIILVGGGAESTMVRSAFAEVFTPKKIFVPEEAGLAVLRGAVLQGLHGENVQFRCLKYTYGVETTPPFIEGTHPEEKRVEHEGKHLCRNVFHKYVAKGSVVRVGDSIKQKFYPIRRYQRKIQSKFFATMAEDPHFTTDEGCKKIGDIVVELPAFQQKNRAIELELFFGDTEIKVDARELDSRKTTDLRLHVSFPVHVIRRTMNNSEVFGWELTSQSYSVSTQSYPGTSAARFTSKHTEDHYYVVAIAIAFATVGVVALVIFGVIVVKVRITQSRRKNDSTTPVSRSVLTELTEDVAIAPTCAVDITPSQNVSTIQPSDSETYRPLRSSLPNLGRVTEETESRTNEAQRNSVG